MGTRADFYIGRGEQAEWLGSIAWDGYPSGIDLTLKEKESKFGISTNKHKKFPKGKHLFDSHTAQNFKQRLKQYFENRDDVTLPDKGWPWPWNTSHTTDYAYAFDEGHVWASCFGGKWFRADRKEPKQEENDKSAVFPDMTNKTRIAVPGTQRSGLMAVSAK